MDTRTDTRRALIERALTERLESLSSSALDLRERVPTRPSPAELLYVIYDGFGAERGSDASVLPAAVAVELSVLQSRHHLAVDRAGADPDAVEHQRSATVDYRESTTGDGAGTGADAPGTRTDVDGLRATAASAPAPATDPVAAILRGDLLLAAAFEELLALSGPEEVRRRCAALFAAGTVARHEDTYEAAEAADASSDSSTRAALAASFETAGAIGAALNGVDRPTQRTVRDRAGRFARAALGTGPRGDDSDSDAPSLEASIAALARECPVGSPDPVASRLRSIVSRPEE